VRPGFSFPQILSGAGCSASIFLLPEIWLLSIQVLRSIFLSFRLMLVSCHVGILRSSYSKVSFLLSCALDLDLTARHRLDFCTESAGSQIPAHRCRLRIHGAAA
jgi:hypothetical protein